jgi:hypothetical protein
VALLDYEFGQLEAVHSSGLAEYLNFGTGAFSSTILKVMKA